MEVANCCGNRQMRWKRILTSLDVSRRPFIMSIVKLSANSLADPIAKVMVNQESLIINYVVPFES